MPHAAETVRATAERWRLGLASSSNRQVIDLVLERTGLADCFAVTVSSEEAGRGKPALTSTWRPRAGSLALKPEASVAIEDSTNGVRSAAAAGMRVVVVPHPELPPARNALAKRTSWSTRWARCRPRSPTAPRPERARARTRAGASASRR